jgi:hypothetical protein
MRKQLVALGVVFVAGSMASAADVSFDLLATVNLDSTANPDNAEFIGSNPSAVAWDGTSLFVAGFNNGGAPTVGVVGITDALGMPVFGESFADLAAPAARGFSGLDITDGVIAAAYDTGSSDPNGITAWMFDGTQMWAKDARGGSGVGIDPGHLGNFADGGGVGWTTFGSGRRALQDILTGDDIYTTGDGMIINGAGTGTFWRDMDFDDATGNIWLREGNNVIMAERTGANSVNTAMLIVDEPEADFVAGQNIAYMGGTPFGDIVIYGDRTDTALGQAFTDVVKVIDPAGNVLTYDLGGLMPDTGSGYYDFSYDAATQTLAVLDFTNRNAYILAVPAPGAASLLGLGGLLTLRRRR